MTTFTKEQLRKEAMKIAARMHDRECPSYYDKVMFIEQCLAAFALSLMERIMMLEAERDVANGTACAEEQADGKGPCGACRNCARAERDEAVADATVLAHAYTTDSRPPQNIVDRSIRRGKDALDRRWAKENE